MKTFFSLLFLVLLFNFSFSQETDNPSCNSNASSFTIEKITVTDNNTTVDLKFYSTNQDYTFWVSSGMYIQEYNNTNSKKYYIKEFAGNELDKKYKNLANTSYHFTWIFESIPKGLTNISIMEPETPGSTAWYWKNIIINNPSSASMTNTSAPDVKIGSYFVTSKNLNVSTYRNGDQIPQVNDPNQWANLKTGAWCYYNNDPSNAAIFGKLYNWYAVNDPRGLAPIGYHVISDNEFTSIISVLGGGSQAGSKLNSVNSCDNGIGTNSSGFNGVLGGYRSPTGIFNYLYKFGGIWSSSEDESNSNNAWYRQLNCDQPNVPRTANSKNIGFSVRCIKDSQTENISQSNSNQANTITDAQNKLNTLVYFTKSGSDKVLIAKLVDGKVYYNSATTNANTNPKWTDLMNYDNTSTILDLNNVAIMSYDGNNYRIINGFYADGQGNRQYLYSNGFKLENNLTALAQFCGGQKFVIEKSQSGNLYYIKFPSNYYYDSNFDEIKNTQSNLSFEIVNSKSLRNDFAIIFFLLKFSKSDTNPCE